MKFIRNLFIIFLVFNCFSVRGQISSISSYPLESVDWRNFNYQQIKIFENILSNNSILVLSELNHGDGTSYDAQCMILKGLIDSNKINTIYTESSWINIDKINEELKTKGKSAIRATYKYMRSVELKYWADNGFWEYLANKIIENKIQLRGFDIDGSSGLIITELFNEALKLPTIQDYINNNKEFKAIKADYDFFDGWVLQSRYNEQSYIEQSHFISKVISDYQVKGNSYRIKQWTSILNMFYWMYKRSLVLKNNKYSNVIETDKQLSLFHSIRDSLMADIFLSYYNNNPDDKCVMLAASYHAMRNSNSIEKLNECCKDEKVNIMGEILDKEIGSKIYSICFIAASGERGINNYFVKKRYYKLKRPVSNSLEYQLEQDKPSYRFIDLKNSNLTNSSFYMNAEFDKYLFSKWSENFSGVFFIKKLYSLDFNNPSVILNVNE